MENECPLYGFLKQHDFVDNFKDYCHLVYNRQIKINDKYVEDPKFKFGPTEIYKAQVGLRVLTNSGYHPTGI